MLAAVSGWVKWLSHYEASDGMLGDIMEQGAVSSEALDQRQVNPST